MLTNYLARQPLRRDFLRVGAVSALGLTLPRLLSRRGFAQSVAPKAKSCILIWLDGGPSHLETFDLKPDAPSEVRGPFKSIPTAVPGINICELLPQTAKLTKHLAIVRSMTSPLGEHGLANQYLLTGYKPSPVLNYPSIGSVVAAQQIEPHLLPNYIAIPDARLAGAGFLGSGADPFVTGGDPAKPDFQIRDLDCYPGMNEQRIQRRLEFLSRFDAVNQPAAGLISPTNNSFQQAFQLMTTASARSAFDLSQESPADRARYGPRTIGQSCLLARRLVERGVPFVTVNNTGWDTHASLVLQLKEGFAGAKVGVGLIPSLDLAFSALIQDLLDRSLLDETLVVVMGEFGRTPKLNVQGGRDHWPRVFSVVLAGGGVRGGQVIGASDRVGESPVDVPVTPVDLACSIFQLLGIDPEEELHTADGRPIRINQGGRMIPGLV